MKRFLSILLSVAMVMTMMPVAFAEPVSENGVDFVAETVETADEAVQGTAAELSAEDEVSYSTDDGGAETTSSLAAAVADIGTGTGTIKVLKDITTDAEIKIQGAVTIDLDGHYISGNNDHRIFSSTGTFTLKDTSEAKTGILKDGYVEVKGTGYSYALGAAIYADNKAAATTVENVKFQNNKVVAIAPENGYDMGYGGAICVASGTLTVKDSAFNENSSSNFGGAIAVVGIKLATISNCSFVSNQAFNSAPKSNLDGGAIDAENVEMITLSGCSFKNNIVKSELNDSDKTQYKSTVGVMGAALCVNVSNAEIKDCIFDGNSVSSANPYVGHGCIAVYDSFAEISNCVVTNNTATGYGGGLYIYAPDPDFANDKGGGADILASKITGNTARIAGDDIIARRNTVENAGNVYIYEVNVSLDDTYIEDGKEYNIQYYYDGYKDGAVEDRYNTANPVEYTGISTSRKSVGLKTVYTEAVDPEVEATYSYYKYPDGNKTKTIRGTLKDTVAQMKADNAYNPSTITVLKDIEISETIILPNTWTLQSAEGSTFTLSRANGFDGVMIESVRYKPVIKNLIFDGNNGTSEIINMGVSGSDKSGLSLTDVTIQNNQNSAIVTKSEITATNVTIKNCSAVYGGAVRFESGATSSSTAKFTNSTFMNNTADTGSAIYAVGDANCEIILDGCTFENNTFTNDASNTDNSTKNSAIYMNSKTKSIFDHIVLKGNTKFANDTAVDIMLDGELGKFVYSDTTLASLRASDTSFNNTGDKIKVAVGAFEKGTYPDNGLVVGIKGSDGTSSFELVDVNGGSKVSTGNKVFEVYNNEYSYLIIGSPKTIALYFNSNSGSISNCDTIAAFNTAAKGIVTLSVAPEFVQEQKPYSEKMIDKAVENINYTLTATANNAKIEKIYISYPVNPFKNNTKEGIISSDGTSATIELTTDLFSTIVSSVSSSVLSANIYVEYQTLAQAITVVQSTGGTISATPSDKAAKGETVTLTATPNDEYNFDAWNVYKTGDSTTKVPVNGNTFTMPDHPVTVSATFVKKKHAVTIKIQGDDDCGKVTIDKTSPVAVGEKVTVTVTNEKSKYELTSLTMNGSPITDNKFTMPNEAVTIKAVFEKTKHVLEYVQSLNGTIQGIAARDALPWGKVLNFTVTPNPYYVIDHVDAIIGGVSTVIPQGADGKYTYTTTPAYTTIKAYYKKQQFTVTANETQNGTIKLISTSPIDWDKNFTINVVANPHYEIDTVTVDGKAVAVSELSELGDYTFTMPTHNVTISATFKKIKYTITGDGNNVTFGIPDKSTYNWGDTVKITVTPDKWYSIKNVYAKDNSSVTVTKVSGKENTYSFTMPASNITIVAVAERPNFTVTFDSQGGSAVTPAIVANGAALTKPAAPSWAGRGFAGWYTDADCTQKYDFTKPVTGDLTLYARWFLWGDVNGDGKADTYDALLIRRCRVGLSDYSLMTNRMAGLVNGVGNRAPDTMDALSIQRCRTGLINRYTVEESAAGYEFDLENNTYIAKS